jgi:hypothetical protein
MQNNKITNIKESGMVFNGNIASSNLVNDIRFECKKASKDCLNKYSSESSANIKPIQDTRPHMARLDDWIKDFI